MRVTYNSIALESFQGLILRGLHFQFLRPQCTPPVHLLDCHSRPLVPLLHLCLSQRHRRSQETRTEYPFCLHSMNADGINGVAHPPTHLAFRSRMIPRWWAWMPNHRIAPGNIIDGREMDTGPVDEMTLRLWARPDDCGAICKRGTFERTSLWIWVHWTKWLMGVSSVSTYGYGHMNMNQYAAGCQVTVGCVFSCGVSFCLGLLFLSWVPTPYTYYGHSSQRTLSTQSLRFPQIGLYLYHHSFTAISCFQVWVLYPIMDIHKYYPHARTPITIATHPGRTPDHVVNSSRVRRGVQFDA